MIRRVDSDASNRSFLGCVNWNRHIQLLAGFFICVVFHHSVQAQGVLMSQPQVTTTPPAVVEAQNDEMDVFGSGKSFLDELAGFNPFHWGPVLLRPYISYRVLYETGARSSTNRQANSIVQTVAPGMLFVLGDHWTLNYSPRWTFYSSDQFRDSITHHASLSFGTSYQNWVLDFSQSYSRSSSILAETGRQTDRENFETRLNASCQLNNKMSLDMSINQSFSLAEGFSNSRQWSTTEWLNYEFAARLNAGIGVGGGYVNQDNSPDQIFENLQARMNWRMTDKTAIEVHGGFDYRQFLGQTGGVPNPTFGVSIQNQAFKATQVSLSANKSISTSYFGNRFTDSTSINLNVSQRLFKDVFLGFGATYSMTDYDSSIGNHSAKRSDESYSINSHIRYVFWKRVSTTLSYQYGENLSNTSGFGYASSQISLDISIHY